MRSAILVLALFFSASINAASFNKRDVGSDVQSCIIELSNTQNQVSNVKSSVQGFNPSAGFLGALAIQNKEQELEGTIKKASDVCCAITRSVTTEEGNAVNDILKNLGPNVQDTLKAIIDKKSTFENINVVFNLVKSDIRNLNTNVGNLDKCILAFIPSNLVSVIQAYVDQVNGAFGTTNQAFGI